MNPAYFLLLTCLFFTHYLFAQKIDPEQFHGIQARSMGPAGMSGRITSIAVDPNDKDTWYIGTASGGLWKTQNGGTTFDPIFDDQAVLSIGALAVRQSDPQVIYVGTGEGNPRNTVSSGGGVYKSTDGGETWECLGLEESRNIHRILIHPENPNIVYVGAIGPPFGQTKTRGLFKSIDGGRSWERILFTNARSGIADLVMHPRDPETIFAAMWEHQRTPWSFTSGGSGSGLFVTKDGGDSWEEFGEEHGLPPKPLGRIGLAIAHSDPQQMYALIESDTNALYHSVDSGNAWERINTETIGSRPFYFAEIHIDPQDPSRIYNLYSRLALSKDGGKEFRVIEDWGRKVHADHHAMWIDKDNPDFIILGTDGGLYWTKDKTQYWNFADDLPVAQFYHVAVDMETPYHVYGGLQDNGTWYGPAYTWHRAGLRNSYWKELAFNDGFDVVVETADPNIVYALWQGGMLVRVNKQTSQRKTIKPITKDVPLRFNWNAAIAYDPFQGNTIFIGSQFVHKSIDRGDSWEIISPDLTTNDPSKQQQYQSGGLTIDATDAENHTTLTVIAPSPIQEGLIWTASDDGLIHRTDNAGKSWENVTPKDPMLPPNTWITQIHPSHYDPKEAFAVFDNHRRDDGKPYLLHTKDGGKSWKSMLNATGIQGPVLSFVQDAQAPNLMFLGTELGLYISLDGGGDWTHWTNGIPSVAISDMLIHPREGDLVLATFGRSMYIIDDIGPLRVLAHNRQAIETQNLHLFDIPDATLGIIQQAHGQRLSPDRIYTGENREYGAIISFWLKENVGEELLIFSVKNSGGTLFTDTLQAKPGLNRYHWNLQASGREIFGPLMDPNLERPWVIPGEYVIQVRKGENSVQKKLNILPDPYVAYSPEAAQASWDLRQRLERLAQEKDELIARLEDKILASDTEGHKKLEALLAMIHPQVRQGVIASSRHIGSRIDKAFYYMHSPYEAPSENDFSLIDQLEKEWQVIETKIEKMIKSIPE